MKLQKLVYYSQAWSLVWEEEPIFEEDFYAWANGPVCKELFVEHKGLFKVDESKIKGNIDALTDIQKETIDAVLDFYGKKDGHWLSMLTHKEKPWLSTRGDIPSGESCDKIIPKELIQEYYDGISQ